MVASSTGFLLQDRKVTCKKTKTLPSRRGIQTSDTVYQNVIHLAALL